MSEFKTIFYFTKLLMTNFEHALIEHFFNDTSSFQIGKQLLLIALVLNRGSMERGLGQVWATSGLRASYGSKAKFEVF